MGLYLDTSHLSPFLCSGFIIVYFNLLGNTPQKAFYYICNLLENLRKGRLVLGSLWISCHTHTSFLFWGIL